VKVGDLVKVKSLLDQAYVGILVDIKQKKELFSDKHSVVETVTYLHILSGGKIEVLDSKDCVVLVLNESR
jgi:hypothetical protein